MLMCVVTCVDFGHKQFVGSHSGGDVIQQIDCRPECMGQLIPAYLGT